MIAFDHVTQFVDDRHASAGTLRSAGLHAVEGGKHQGFGSANDLCHFDLFYIEMLEIIDREEAANSGSEVCRYAVDFLTGGEGLATLAFETDDLTAVRERLIEHGFTVAEPVSMQRVHDDGFVSHSKIIYPESSDLDIIAPIVIERSATADQRRDSLRSVGVVADHPLGEIAVEFIGVAVRDALASAATIGAAYGVSFDTDLRHEGTDRYADVQLDRARLRFVEPTTDDGAAAARLAARGPGPFCIGVKTTDATVETLNRIDGIGWCAA
ncbi:VOC family protein [Rhodococcoides yunnanense]|uniref:VOC family protein n=1 Tax=Rhodococcoides yunnanense TaxID=278209 RepID=UPI000934F793|nr:VOC family protein [Rhodococcus yunnanensis]